MALPWLLLFGRFVALAVPTVTAVGTPPSVRIVEACKVTTGLSAVPAASLAETLNDAALSISYKANLAFVAPGQK